MSKRQRELENNINYAIKYFESIERDFDIDYLRSQFNEFKKLKYSDNINYDEKEKLRQHSNLFRNYQIRKNRQYEYEKELALLLDKKVVDVHDLHHLHQDNVSNSSLCLSDSELAEIINIDEESFESSNQRIQENMNSRCMNCYRQKHVESPTLNFYTINRHNVRMSSKKFRKIESSHCPNERSSEAARRKAVEKVILCEECHNALNSGLPFTNIQANSYEYLWPSFIYKFLIDETEFDPYSFEEKWKFIPDTWRGWWLAVANDMDSSMSITFPPPKFNDITANIDEFEEDIRSYNLSRLIKCTNKHLVPKVLCPWGCSEYVHKCGHLHLDIVLQRYLKRNELSMINEHCKCNYVDSSRDDYLLRDDDYESWLFNNDLKAKPSVAILPGKGAVVLTCRLHNGGTPKKYFHIPRSPRISILPAASSDQLAPIVMKPRTIKQMKKSKYCTKFQMVEQRGSFQGIDTFEVTAFKDFGFGSAILDDSESRILSYRPDIRAMLSTYVENGSISQQSVNARIQRSNELYGNDDVSVKLCVKGTTYMPLREAMLAQTLVGSTNTLKVLVDHKFKETGERIVKMVSCKRIWPLILFPCQKYDPHDNDNCGCYGATFPVVKCTFSHMNHCLTWIIAIIVSRTQEIWDILNSDSYYLRSSQWEGWTLAYIAKTYFKEIRWYSSNNPFSLKLKEMKDISILTLKLYKAGVENLDDLRSMFGNHDSICSIQFGDREFYDDNIDTATHDVVIISGSVKEEGCEFLESHIYEMRHLLQIKRFYEDSDDDSCSCTEMSDWSGISYSRHGGICSKWWKQHNDGNYVLHSRSKLESPRVKAHLLNSDDFICVVYVRKSSVSPDDYRDKFLSLIGGQSHLRCYKHNTPLITSATKDKKCSQCNLENELYSCSCTKCCVCICRNCHASLTTEEISYIDVDGSLHNILSQNSDDDSNNNYEKTFSRDGSDKLSDIQFGSSLDKTLYDKHLGLALSDEYHDIDEDNSLYSNISEEILDSSTNSNMEFDHDLINGYDNISERSSSVDDGDDSISYGQVRWERNKDNDNVMDYFMTYDMDDDEPINDMSDEDIDPIPTSNSANKGYIIEQQTSPTDYVSGRVLLNTGAASLLTRSNYRINAYSKQKHFMEKMASTCYGQSQPLLYLEAQLFPSIFYFSIPECDGAIGGALPSCLFIGEDSPYGIASLDHHIRSRLTSPSIATSTDYRYNSFTYDVIANLTANHQDNRIILNRGLTVNAECPNEIGVRSRNDSSIFESIDSMRMVRNLAASQKYHQMDIFFTLTANQMKTFGLKVYRLWVHSGEWKQSIPNWNELSAYEQNEYCNAMEQASSGLMLRNWLEVKELLTTYLLKSESSPFRGLGAIFVRDEYQADQGNLPHIHAIFQLKGPVDDNHSQYITELVRASVGEIVREDEVQSYIDKGLFTSWDDVYELEVDAIKFLGHHCTPRCQIRIGPDEGPENFRCRKPNNLKLSPDCTSHCFIDLPVKYTEECKDALKHAGLLDISVDEYGIEHLEFHHKFFQPTRHIPPTNPSNDINMSPVIGELFVATRSMQNAQAITQTNACNSYLTKYTCKMDEATRHVLGSNIHKGGYLTVSSKMLHNTKITTSKINEDKAFQKSREKNHPSGRPVSDNERLQLQLRYPEVRCNMQHVQVQTTSMELRAGVERTKEHKVELPDGNDGNFTGNIVDLVREQLGLINERQMRRTEVMTASNAFQTSVSIDCISKFSVRPPELRNLFDSVEIYFRWTYIEKHDFGYEDLLLLISGNLFDSCLIDGLGHKVKINTKAFDEIMCYFDCICSELDNQFDLGMIEYIKQLNMMWNNTQYYTNLDDEDNEKIRYNWIMQNVLHDDQSTDFLPIPVYSDIKPKLGHQFILHILLSLGRFNTEIDLTMHNSLRDSLRYAKLIGPNTDVMSLKKYSGELLHKYIVEQLVFFTNSKRAIDSMIIEARNVFDAVIIDDTLPIIDMPPVLLSSIARIQDEKLHKFWNDCTERMLKSIYLELEKSNGVERCNIPDIDTFNNASREHPVEWKALQNFSPGVNQSEQSFQEQKIAIEMITKSSTLYLNGASTYVKNCGIVGAPGTGKTTTVQYCALEMIGQGLRVTATSIMARRSQQVGGIEHVHTFFMLNTNNFKTPQGIAKHAILRILRNGVKLNILKTLDVLILDEAGTVQAKLLSVIDIILRQVRGTGTPFGGVLIVFTLDHTQFAAIGDKPFLTSSHIISCFQAVELTYSVRACNDPDYERVQRISRMHPRYYNEDPSLLTEYRELVGRVFTFAKDWSDRRIDPSTFRLYGKHVPAQEETLRYINSVKSQKQQGDYIERDSEDVENHMNSNTEWNEACDQTSKFLDKAVKEPRQLLLFKGGIYSFTYNKNDMFSQFQICLLHTLPSRDKVNHFKPIDILAAPPGIQDIQYDENESMESYIQKGWKNVRIKTAPERTKRVSSDIQAQRRQYGLKHHVTSTIHASMGDTLNKVALQISSKEQNFKLWDRAQVIVATSRTKLGKNTIFVGNKQDTINALVELIQKSDQWTDYMEYILDMITINRSSNTKSVEDLTFVDTFPFRIRDMPIPTCKTGFVYFLVSIKSPQAIYIGETQCLKKRLKEHNSGYGSKFTSHVHLRPWAIYAYISGFCCNKALMRRVECLWQQKRNRLIQNGNTQNYDCALQGNEVIDQINQDDAYAEHHNQLNLVILCNEKQLESD